MRLLNQFAKTFKHFENILYINFNNSYYPKLLHNEIQNDDDDDENTTIIHTKQLPRGLI